MHPDFLFNGFASLPKSSRPPGALALLAFYGGQALAQSAPPPAPAAPPSVIASPATDQRDEAVIVVTGTRASLASAQSIKREQSGIVDAVVADDINKLPDFSVTDALQRVTGVQIARDRGDGGVVTLRGLTQLETTLNGREVFTAGPGRNLDFADIPAEMLSSITVHKTASAEQIDGGVGGLIELRSRRPFDFGGPQLSATARTVYGDLVDQRKGQYSLLASQRWSIGNDNDGGEFGALISLAEQERAWREDQKSAGNPILRTDLVAGHRVVAPNGTSESTSLGTRQRRGADLVLQWWLDEHLDLYAEGSFSELKTRQNTHQINVTAAPSFVAGSPVLFPGSDDLQRITWTNAPVSLLSFARDTVDRNTQGAIGGRWTQRDWTIKADLSRSRSFNSLYYAGPVFRGSAANFSHELSPRVPGSSVSGTDLADPANFTVTGIAYRYRPYEGSLNAARLDAERRLDAGPFTLLGGGLRLARRAANNGSGLIFADTAVNIPAASRPADVTSNPYTDFFPGSGSASLANHLVGRLDQARDAAAFRAAFGISTPIPAAGDPLGVWKIKEETRAGYLTADFAAARLPLDGKIGLRVVHTHESVAGSQSVPDTGTIAPIAIDSSYLDALPSLSLRYEAAAGLILRGAAAKTITRPNFDQLSPSLSLLRNSVDPTLNQGSAGNPELRPVRANSLDVAVERYFSRNHSISLSAFVKQVDGFVTTVSRPESHYGALYQVSRPQNSAAGKITGYEFGYQQFFDFLPGWLGGLGLQANYTLVDSKTPSSVLGQDVPLQNLSRHSYNLIAMYEKNGYSARVAYNWRDRFLSGIANFVDVGAVPVYTRAYGWLDASLIYRANAQLSFAVEGLNLLRTQRSSYYGVETRPQSSWTNDTQFAASMTIRL